MPDDPLSLSLQFLKGVGPRKAADLRRAGLSTLEDLLYRLPFRYEDRSRMQPIASLRPGARAAVLAEIKTANLVRTRRRGFVVFHAVVADDTGAIRCTWMNQAFLRDILVPSLRVVIFGEVKLDSTGLHFLNPEYEIADEPASDEAGVAPGLRTGRIVPFYEKTGSVTPNMQRRLVRSAVESLPDPLPDPLPAPTRERWHLMARREAMVRAHFPDADASVEDLSAFRTPAQWRLIFEEFFLFQIGHAWRRRSVGAEVKPFVPTVDVHATAPRIG